MAEGGTLVFLVGPYVVRTPVALQPRVSGRFAPSIVLIGDGTGQTIFEDRTTGSALFDFDSDSDPASGFRAIRGVHLSGFTIEGGHSGPATAAIRLRGCYQSSVSDIHTIDRPGTGIAIPCL